MNTLYLWISLGLAEASHWTVSVLIKFLLPELMSNVHSKLYKKLFTCICIYITFVHYGFGLHTYHISLKVQFFLACIHTVTYHSSKKIKYPKEVKKTSQGDANELKQGSRNVLGARGGAILYLGRNRSKTCSIKSPSITTCPSHQIFLPSGGPDWNYS